MEEHEGIILDVNKTHASIQYIYDLETVFQYPLQGIQFQGQRCNPAVLLKGTRLLLKNPEIRIHEEENLIHVRYGKISLFSNERLGVEGFSTQESWRCMKEFVDVNGENFEDTIGIPVESIFINKVCACVRLIKDIPYYVNAVVLEVKENRVYLEENEKKRKIVVNSQQCFEKFAVKALEIEEIMRNLKRTAIVGVFISNVRVEIDLDLGKLEEPKENIKAGEQRAEIQEFLPENYSDNDLHIEKWFINRAGFPTTPVFTVFLSLFEVVLTEKPHIFDTFTNVSNQKLQDKHIQPFVSLLEDIKKQFIIEYTIFFSEFYNYLLDNLDLFINIANDLVPNAAGRILFDQFTQSFNVCVNFFEVLEENVIRSFYSIENITEAVPVLNLLGKNGDFYVIYSGKHLKNSGFSLVCRQQQGVPQKKSLKWPIYYFPKLSVELAYVSIVKQSFELMELVKTGFTLKDPSIVQQGLHQLASEIESKQKILSKLSILSLNPLTTSLKSFDFSIAQLDPSPSRALQDFSQCSYCKRNKSLIPICASVDYLCEFCIMNSKKNGNICLTCQGPISIPPNSIFRCKTCRNYFPHHRVLICDCNTIYCDTCYTREINEKGQCKNCQKSDTIGKIADFARKVLNDKCECGKGKAKHKVCERCEKICDFCAVKLKGTNNCKNCNSKLSKSQEVVSCMSCRKDFSIIGVSNLSCGCIVCMHCAHQFRMAQDTYCKICLKSLISYQYS